jgi:tRNA pseudouridine38-40 synthase
VRYRARVEYDGTEFAGFQVQPGSRTVQGELERVLSGLAGGTRIKVEGAGRTDAGVHAAGQVAGFVTESDLPADRLRHAIGSRLPKDVSILSVRDVHPQFHATQSAISKLYRYRIWNSRRRPVERLLQRYTHHIWEPLDVDRMRAGARHFLGQKDFAAMAARGNTTLTTVRTILRCDIERHFEEIRFNVEGTGFLYNQVRNMVGTLLNVGMGRWEPDRIAEILAGGDRAAAGATLPARGLCLQWVRYPPELLRPPP